MVFIVDNVKVFTFLELLISGIQPGFSKFTDSTTDKVLVGMVPVTRNNPLPQLSQSHFRGNDKHLFSVLSPSTPTDENSHPRLAGPWPRNEKRQCAWPEPECHRRHGRPREGNPSNTVFGVFVDNSCFVYSLRQLGIFRHQLGINVQLSSNPQRLTLCLVHLPPRKEQRGLFQSIPENRKPMALLKFFQDNIGWYRLDFHWCEDKTCFVSDEFSRW